MADVMKMILCCIGGVLWAKSVQWWAPHTPLWLAIGLVPSVLLCLVGIFFAIRIRQRQLRDGRAE
jgi:hypothetical protein